MMDHSSSCLLLALATVLRFNMYSLDVAHVYLYSSSDLFRKIFVKPDVLNLQADELLQLVKPIYGFTDSEEY